MNPPQTPAARTLGVHATTCWIGVRHVIRSHACEEVLKDYFGESIRSSRVKQAVGKVCT